MEKALVHLGVDPETVNANIFFVSVRTIKRLNREHRGINKPTDVLSFPTLNIKGGTVPTRTAFPLDINPETNKIELGDIVICKKKARKNARAIGHSLGRELEFLRLHGLLHLLGYDHLSAADEEVMTKLQREILGRE